MRYLSCLSLLLLGLAGCGGSSNNPSSPSTAPRPGITTGEVGNGEHGFLVGGKVYSMDLVEAGIEKNPHFGFSFLETRLNAWNSLILMRVRRKFQGQNFPIDKLALKLHDIFLADPVLGLSLLQTIEMYHWHLVPRDLRLLPFPGPMVDLHEGDIVLVANRRGRSIFLAEPFWKLMDEANQTAAMIHEAIYALIKPRPDPHSRDPRVFFAQDSVRVREITGLLFTKEPFDPSFVLNPEELPFLTDAGALPTKTYASTLDSLNYLFTLRDNRQILLPAVRVTLIGEPLPAAPAGAATYEVSLSDTDPFLTRHKDPLSTRFGAPPSGTMVDLQKFCHDVQGKADHRYFIRWETIASDRNGDPLNLQLTFGTYQSEKEEKTYVKVSPAPAIPPKEAALTLTLNDEKKCLEETTKEAWKFSLSLYHAYSTYVPEGEPIFNDMYGRTPFSMRNGAYRPDWIYRH